MLPITDFLSCTDPLDEFESLSYHQTHHAKMHVTGLAAASSKTITGIAREVLPAQGDLAHAYSLLDEAQAAVERTQHDDTEQTYREIAYDCYD